MDVNESVYTGFWTNWADGKVLGSTLTLTARDGAYVIALLALFVRVVGGHLWEMITFLSFRLRSSPAGHDGLFHQQQVILRNTASDSRALWRFVQSGFHWRGKVKHPLLRSLYLAGLAALHIAAFAIAGVFSSRVATARSEVLLDQSHCGLWSFLTPSNDSSFSQITEWVAYEHDNLAKASRLASTCYNGTQALSSEYCPIAGRRLIQWNMSTEGACPFSSSICPSNQAITLDSGPIDTLYDLGINSHPNDRITFRQVSQCSPLIVSDHLTGWQAANATLLGRNSQYNNILQYKSLLLGSNLETQGSATISFSNTTFDWGSTTIGDIPHFDSYLVDVEWYDAKYAEDILAVTWDPISELKLNDSVVNIFSLVNGANYPEPVDDPWFQATNESQSTQSFYSSGQQIQVLGCSSQYFVCNPSISNASSCSQFSMLSTLDNIIDTPEDSISFNAAQKSMLARLMNATTLSTMPRVPANLGASSLLASSYLDEQDSLPLPDNQWILELQNWVSTSLIALQLHSLSYVQNNDPQWASVNKTAPASDEAWMCDNQIVRRTDYTSFSVFGLAFIIVVGGLIILVNLGLVRIVERLQRKTPRNEYRSLEWSIQGTLQLQRLAYEAHGLGRWQGEGEVPTTVGDESFALPEDKLGLERTTSNSSLEARSWDATGHASGEAYPLKVGPSVAAPRSVSSVEVAPEEDDNAGVPDSSRFLLQQDRRLCG